ncbi:tetratricopeptide repeat protein [Thiospirochaeta perfilievii]|uniref:Tetratricopeptide repeat protein n=1 Tax=Thiospirochaeta perfilievii TaxID=252967 RepID=A0A5C1Q955_9SPIO|nr:tetratricopeptide repeat protein [Thiospirochaeta perfilievii]QEN03590.1 tetratricopeptide repeat protein [Thiospirochaeta perfilievii]
MLENQLKKAINEYNKGLYSEVISTLLLSDYSDEDFIVYYYLGLCYIKIGDYEGGKESLEHYIELDDNLLRVFQGRMLLAFASIQLEDYKEAQLHLDKLLDSGYESAKLYSLLGFIYYKKKMMAKSVKYYRLAISIDPENANALNSLGYILADYKDDLKEAETLCRRALSINVDNPAYLDSLGWVCLKNNKFSASQSFFNRALMLSPKNDVITKHIKELEKVGPKL